MKYSKLLATLAVATVLFAGCGIKNQNAVIKINDKAITQAEYDSNKEYYDSLDAIIEITDSNKNGGDASNVKYGNTDVATTLDSINSSLASKLSFKNIAIVKSGESVDITLPFNSAGFIVFNGATNTMQSFFQYLGFSNGIAGRTIGSQGTALSYSIKSGTSNVLTVANLSSGNTLIVDAIVLRGNFPQ